MEAQRPTMLFDTTMRLLRRGAHANIRRIISKTHPADLAILFHRFDVQRRTELFNLLSSMEVKAEVISEMRIEDAVEVLVQLPVEEVGKLVNEMGSDDAADLLGRMPPELSEKILALISGDDSMEVEGLLKYPEDTAGGIMTPEFIGLPESTNVEDAIKYIRDNRNVEMAFYVYVVNSHGQLVGVLSLRQLVVSHPSKTLKEIMEPRVVSVRVYTDQEDVARLVARYNLLAVPVVDDRNNLLGLVTVDDVIDVLKEEATEDILKMAGVGQVQVATDTVRASFRARLPWLMVGFLGELVGVSLSGPFGEMIRTHYYLAFFMPVIIAMGGNIGTQSAATIVRGLATGRYVPAMVRSIYFRELRVALMMGVVYGSVVGVVGYFVSGMELGYAVSVAISMILAMAIAVTVGTLLPLFFAKVKIDPAVSTGPFITSAVDVLGLLAYFMVSSLIIGTI